jgi:hypothetical protein
MQQINIDEVDPKEMGYKGCGGPICLRRYSSARFYNKVMHLSVPFKAANFLISCEAFTSSNGLWIMVFAICDASFSWC